MDYIFELKCLGVTINEIWHFHIEKANFLEYFNFSTLYWATWIIINLIIMNVFYMSSGNLEFVFLSRGNKLIKNLKLATKCLFRYKKTFESAFVQTVNQLFTYRTIFLKLFLWFYSVELDFIGVSRGNKIHKICKK